MNEGWYGECYVVLFSEEEMVSANQRYGIEAHLPGYAIVGLQGWDDFIVRNRQGRHFTVPTVPLDARHLSPCELPNSASLKHDDRFTGRIKWYIKPLVFSGDPHDESNQTWVNHQEHSKLVVWWNHKYLEVSTGSAGA